MFFGYGASLLVDDFYGWNVPVTGTFLYSDKIDCIYKGGRSEAKRNYAITMVLVWYYYGNGMVL